jgi:hypothetical protein
MTSRERHGRLNSVRGSLGRRQIGRDRCLRHRRPHGIGRDIGRMLTVAANAKSRMARRQGHEHRKIVHLARKPTVYVKAATRPRGGQLLLGDYAGVSISVAQFAQFLERYPRVKEQNRYIQSLLRSWAYPAVWMCQASARS